MDQHKPSLRNNKTAKTILRIIGFIFTIGGLVCVIIAFIDFFTKAIDMNGSMLTKFYLFFIGFPCLFIGVVCLSLGFMKAVSSYVASEQAPVAKDVNNYMLDGTRDETVKTVKSCSDAIKGNASSESAGVVCPKCGVKNEPGAKFCDHCGEPLTKTCSNCGEVNDIDSTFCRKCGKKL